MARPRSLAIVLLIVSTHYFGGGDCFIIFPTTPLSSSLSSALLTLGRSFSFPKNNCPLLVRVPKKSCPIFFEKCNVAALCATASKEEKEEPTTEREGAKKNGFFKRALEGAVREVTGETDYVLGDLGERPPPVAKEEEYTYQFGDITKSILAEIQQRQNFWDTSNTTTTEKETGQQQQQQQRDQLIQQLDVWKNSLIEKDVPINVLGDLFSRLDKNQRINLILTGCQFGAEGVVLWGFVTNICTLWAASLSWAATLRMSVAATGSRTVPLVPFFGMEQAVWQTFSSKFVGASLLLNPFFLIVQAIGTLVGFRKYHALVMHLSTSKFITEGKGWGRYYHSTVLNKALAVILAFFLTNIILSAMAAGMVFSTISVIFRLWLAIQWSDSTWLVPMPFVMLAVQDRIHYYMEPRSTLALTDTKRTY